MIICTTTDDRYRLQIFPKAELLVLYDDKKKEIVKTVKNTEHSRPKVTKKCIELKPEAILAPRGSLCYPSYVIAKKSGVKILIDYPNKLVNEISPWDVSMGEVVYSSILAIYQRIIGF
ncbi:MAG: hypothetical protein QXS44_00575 [Saccharolobus sp.]